MIQAISKPDQLKKIILKKIKNGEYKPGDRLPSIKAIYEEFNVSKHTVSQALSNLSELGAIEMAHGKVTRVSDMPFRKVIEIIHTGITPLDQQEFWAEFYRGIVDEINATTDYSYANRVVEDIGSSNDLKLLDLKNAIGGLLVGTANPVKINYLKRYGISLLMVYERVPEEDISYVSVDYHDIMTEMVGRFAKNGRSRIAYIGSFSGQTDKGINTDKYDCFVAALQKHNVKVDYELHRNAYHTMKEGYCAMKGLLAKNRPDGVFLSSDALAPGVYRALSEAGIKIPQDISVIGCDNLEIGSYLVPALTTIELSRYKIGRLAAAKLIRNIEDGNGGKLTQVDFTPEIVVRESE